MGKIMDVDKLKTYQKNVLFHFTYVESKLFRNRMLIMFLSSLILSLTASCTQKWYYESIIPNIETSILALVSVALAIYLTRMNSHLRSASIFLIEMHTKVFMMLNIIKHIEDNDLHADCKSILDSEIDHFDKEFKKRFRP